MKAIYSAQLVSKGQLMDDFISPKLFDEEFYEVFEEFLRHSGEEFFVKEQKGTLNVFGICENNFCTHLLATEEEIEFFMYTCSVFDLTDEDIENRENPEEFLFNFSMN